MNETNDVNLESFIYSLEEKLMDFDTRCSAERIAELLSQDFLNFVVQATYGIIM